MANKSIDECKDLKTLFELWKNKSPKNINGFEINHKDNVFISEAGDYKLGNAQKLNGCLGLGVWF